MIYWHRAIGWVIFLAAVCLCACNGANHASAGHESTEANSAATNNLRATVETAGIGHTEIEVKFTKAPQPGPLYFRPHENETTASEAAQQILAQYGGTLVELKSRGQRFISFLIVDRLYTFDPNRIFSSDGIKRTLADNGKYEVEAEQAIADFVNAFWTKHLADHHNLLIALHNNTDGKPLTIQTYQDNPEAAAINLNPRFDEDDFFYVTSEAHFDFLKEKGFNVARQNNATVVDDGSLSVFCGKRGIDYINIECEQGHLKQQIEMLRAIQELLKQ